MNSNLEDLTVHMSHCLPKLVQNGAIRQYMEAKDLKSTHEQPIVNEAHRWSNTNYYIRKGEFIFKYLQKMLLWGTKHTSRYHKSCTVYNLKL